MNYIFYDFITTIKANITQSVTNQQKNSLLYFTHVTKIHIPSTKVV